MVFALVTFRSWRLKFSIEFVVLNRYRFIFTNSIESLNATYRKLNRQRNVFPSDTVLLKALYLATFEATKKWTTTIRDWAKVYGELSIMYEGRLPEYKKLSGITGGKPHLLLTCFTYTIIYKS